MVKPGDRSAVRDKNWLIVSVVVVSGVIAATHAGKAAIATPLLQKDLGIDLVAAGWLTGIFAILGCVGGIPAGSLVGRVGDRGILIAGLGLAALGGVLGAAAPGYESLLLSRVLEGLGFLLVAVAGPAILSRVVRSEQHDFALALWSCFVPAGLALVMLFGPLFGDWRALWWGSAGLACLAVLSGWMVIPPARTQVSPSWRRTASDAMHVAASKGPILFACFFAVYSLMFFALFSFLPVLLMERMSFSYATAGWLSAVATSTNIIGNIGAGYLLLRGIRRKTLLAGAYLIMGLSALGIFLPAFGSTPTFLLCMLFAAVGGLIPATLISGAPLLAPSAALTPIVTGLLMQGSNLGQVAGPVAIGSAVQAYGWLAAVAIVVSLAFIAAIAAACDSFIENTKS
jgi:predicted MFS family arabinose efflux permease